MVSPMREDERILLAAELVLGLLDSGERADALELLATDPAFAAEVRRWEAQLAPLFAGFDQREPPRDLYPEIRARLDRIESYRGRHSSASAERMEAANENRPGAVAPGWRWAAIGSGAAAAVLAAVLLFTPGDRGATDGIAGGESRVAESGLARPTVVAQLSGDEGSPVMVASVERGQPVLRVRLIDADVGGDEPADMVPVLWVIAGEKAPEAIGALPRPAGAGGEVISQLALRKALVALIDSGATLAVTYEPADASSYDAPTTTIVAKGTLSPL